MRVNQTGTLDLKDAWPTEHPIPHEHAQGSTDDSPSPMKRRWWPHLHEVSYASSPHNRIWTLHNASTIHSRAQATPHSNPWSWHSNPAKPQTSLCNPRNRVSLGFIENLRACMIVIFVAWIASSDLIRFFQNLITWSCITGLCRSCKHFVVAWPRYILIKWLANFCDVCQKSSEMAREWFDEKVSACKRWRSLLNEYAYWSHE